MQSELSHYHPDSLLWFCFVSCNQSVNKVVAACENTRPSSKGCCHLSRHWSLWSSCWSPSSLHHPSCTQRSRHLHCNPAHHRGGVRTVCCSVLASRGVQALLTGAHKPEGSILKAGATSQAATFSSAPRSWCCPSGCRVSDAAAQPDIPETAAVPLSAMASEQPKR